MKFILLFTPLMILACTHGLGVNQRSSDKQSILASSLASFDWFDHPNGNLNSTHGEKLTDVITYFGEPEAKETFRMHNGLYEYQIELYNYYPDKKDGSDRAEITEMHWSKTKKNEIKHLYLWFHYVKNELVVLHSLQYDHGTEF